MKSLPVEASAGSKHGSEKVARTELAGCPLMPTMVLRHSPQKLVECLRHSKPGVRG